MLKSKFLEFKNLNLDFSITENTFDVKKMTNKQHVVYPNK